MTGHTGAPVRTAAPPDAMNPAEMLALPKTCGLTAGQLSGSRCVWCAGAASVDLGPRLSTLDGRLHPWRPTGCGSCTRLEARRVFAHHIRSCALCRRATYCPDVRALQRLGWPERTM